MKATLSLRPAATSHLNARLCSVVHASPQNDLSSAGRNQSS